MQAAGGEVPIYQGLGTLAFPITTRDARAQSYFNQGLRLSFAFNHAEAQRAFQTAQKLDPNCAACFWGEALILGPNINVPMMPEANAPALAALDEGGGAQGSRRSQGAGADRGAAAALLGRPQARAPGAGRGICGRDAQGRRTLPGRRHDRRALCRERDGHPAVGLLGARRRHAQGPRRRDRLQPRDGAQAQPDARRRHPSLHPRGRGVDHAGAGAAVCRPPRRADARRRSHRAHAGTHLLPGGPVSALARHQQARGRGRRAVLPGLALRPALQERLLPAQHPLRDGLGADGRRRRDRGRGGEEARCGGARGAGAAVPDHGAGEGRAIHHPGHLRRPRHGAHPARARREARARPGDVPLRPGHGLRAQEGHRGRAAEVAAITALDAKADYKPYEPWGVPAKTIVETARLVALGRIADAAGDLERAAAAYEEAVALQDS